MKNTIKKPSRDKKRINKKAPLLALKYKLTWLPSSHELRVDLIYTPVQPGSTVFKYGEPDFGGQKDILTSLKNIQVDAPDSFKLNEATRTITVCHAENKPVHIHYSVIDTRPRNHGPMEQLFRPILTDNEFSIHGINLFLQPLFKKMLNKDVLQSVSWEKWPENITLFQSVDPQNRGDTLITAPVDKFVNGLRVSVMIAAADLQIQCFPVDNIPVYAIAKKDSVLHTTAFQAYMSGYFSSARKFWNNYVDHYYFIILLPFLPPLDKTENIGGMGLQNGHLSKYMSDDKSLSNFFIKHFSHEIVHNWIGLKVYMDMHAHSWFNEGFTDYISWYILVREAFWDAENFVENFNKNILKPHYNSINKNIHNSKIIDKFWNPGEDNSLPYQRGALFAFYLDNQIRLKSSNKKNIRNLLLSIQQFSKNKNENFKLTQNDFIRLTAQFLPEKQVKKDFTQYIINGDSIVFSSDNLCPVFQVHYQNNIPVITAGKKLKNFYQF